jgi:hypothetical protein
MDEKDHHLYNHFGGVENINAERYHIVEMNSKDEISLHVQDEIIFLLAKNSCLLKYG